MIAIERWLDILIDYYWDYRIPFELRFGIIDSISLDVFSYDKYSSGRFENTLKKKLRFDSAEGILRASHLLESLAAVFNQGNQFDDWVGDDIRRALESVMSGSDGSYLLHRRAQQLVSLMREDDYIWSEADALPFELARGKTGYIKEDGPYLVPESALTELLSIAQERSRIEDQVHEGDVLEGEYDILYAKYDKLRQKSIELASVKVTLSDLGIRSRFGLSEEELTHEYNFLMSHPMRVIVRQDFGIELSELTLPEQFQFLDYLLGVSYSQAGGTAQFTGVFGVAGARTFLATSIDEKAGEEILALGEWAGADARRLEQVQAVFAKFCQLTDTIDSVEKFMEDTFRHSDPETVRAMIRTTLERARKIISDAHAAVGKGGEVALAGVLRVLETNDIAMRRFLDGCQELKKQGALDPEGILGAQLIPRYGSDLASDEEAQKEIVSNLRTRYADRPESFRTKVEGALREAMQSPDSLFYLYYLPVASGKRRLAGLFRLDEKKVDGRVTERHFASMFLNPLFEKGGLMSTLAQSILAKASADAPVAAECFITGAPITSEYLNWGFVATSESRSLGMQLLNITLDPGRFSSLKTRGKLPSRETIMRAADVGKSVAYPGSDVEFYGGDVPPNFQQEYFDKGFMMTHYFQAASSGRYYALFERPRR